MFSETRTHPSGLCKSYCKACLHPRLHLYNIGACTLLDTLLSHPGAGLPGTTQSGFQDPPADRVPYIFVQDGAERESARGNACVCCGRDVYVIYIYKCACVCVHACADAVPVSETANTIAEPQVDHK